MFSSITMNNQLNRAVARGDLEAVRKLVNAGANINAKSSNRTYGGLTPLMIAAHGGDSKIIRYLLNKGANARTRMPNGDNRTAIHFAAESSDVNSVRSLIPYSNLRARDGNGRSVFTIAAGKRDPKMFLMLIRAGARPNNNLVENLVNNNNRANLIGTELMKWSHAKRAIARNLKAAAMSRRTHAMRKQLGSVHVRTGSTYVNGVPVHIRNMIAAHMRRR